jgi:arylsulfatase A-like enzyme
MSGSCAPMSGACMSKSGPAMGTGSELADDAAEHAAGPDASPAIDLHGGEMNRLLHTVAAGLLASASLSLGATPASPAGGGGETIFANGFEPPPNILLVILDDVGVDQMPSFGYGGSHPPSMPTIDAIAGGGLRFRNTWSMPECSPGRSTLLTGRYPLRNNINQALGPDDLANSQVSPYEVTAPKLLDHAGYASGKFGKTHLGGPEHNQAGHGAVGQLGWDYFHGWMEGVPGSIDPTAGGIVDADNAVYSCGFVPDTARDPVNGADTGACYVRDGAGVECTVITGTTAHGDSPGLQCLTRGGILVPNASCQATPPANLDWNRQNAHYVSALVINDGDEVEQAAISDPRGRGYRATLEADATIEWIREQQQAGGPWMATLSFSNAHTPLQQPPGALLPSGLGHEMTASCTTPLNKRRLYNAMVEASDTELARVLIETGIATADGNGGVSYDPAASNTVVIIVGDNGSFFPDVKVPFDASRSKGSAYQTGVWVPLIVAGPTVAEPGRTVEHMVNMVDVYRLFGELAGLSVPALVPRIVDGASMLPYLTDPAQPSIRAFNFTQGGLNIQANGGRNGPCVMGGTTCSHTPMTQAICEDNNGVWWGVGADPEQVIKGGLEQCWQVNQVIFHDDPANYDTRKVAMAPTDYRAIRNEHFKLVRNTAMDYDVATDTGVENVDEELYRINQAVPLPLLDRAEHDLLGDGKLTPLQAIHYAQLRTAMQALEDSKVPCPGDGNDDGRVDQADIDNYNAIVGAGWSGSSTYDFDIDGHTDGTDLQIIEDHLGTTCFTVTP